MLATKLVEVLSGARSRFRPEVIDFEIRVELEDGSEEIWPFTYVPTDGAPITHGVKLWLEAHPDFEIGEAAPLTPEDFHLSRRDVRTAFITLGLPADATETAIKSRPAGGEREDMLLSWLEDDYFQRDSAVVLATFEYWYGIDPNHLTPEGLDTRWMQLGKRALTGEDRATSPSEEIAR